MKASDSFAPVEAKGKMAISDPAVSAPGKILMQIAKKALIFILLGINSHCRSYPEPDEMQEYYFYGKYTQLHGLARVPARTIDKEKATVTTLGERRNACREEAIRDAQARFLALTLIQPLDASEWHRRLNMGAKGEWWGCFERARVRNLFFEYPDYCRVVLVIPCEPGDY